MVPRLTPENLGDSTYQRTQEMGVHIVKTTIDPTRYIALRQAEGRTSARLLGRMATRSMHYMPALIQAKNTPKHATILS